MKEFKNCDDANGKNGSVLPVDVDNIEHCSLYC